MNPRRDFLGAFVGISIASVPVGLQAAGFVQGDATANLTGIKFIDDAATGGGDVTVNDNTSPALYGPLDFDLNGDGVVSPAGVPVEVNFSGFAFATSATAEANDATELTISFTYLGADGVGGGDDVFIGQETVDYSHLGSGEYYVNFTGPISGVIDGLNTKFRITVTVSDLNAGLQESVRFKTGPRQFETTNGAKFSVSGSAVPAVVNDSDSDNLDDSWETGGEVATGTLGPYIGPTDTGTFLDKADSDGDGIDDGDEIFGETFSGKFFVSNPTLANSDGDTISDGDEVNGVLNAAYSNEATNPTLDDTDDDGVDDFIEMTVMGTNPNLADTDGDGIDDIDEDVNLNGIVDTGETDPTMTSTDGDSLPDGWEIAVGLDPFSSLGDDGDSGDPDQDLLDNLAEYNGGANSTDPKDADSDNDKLSDKVERDGTTNPNSRDSDGDTMSDAQELALGLNPLAIEDFDDDDAGIGNGFDHHEVLFYDTNPKNSGEFPPLPGVQVDKLSAGYTIGSGLLGADMILDEALGGGNDYRFGTGNTNFSFVYQGLYNPGTNVTITGLAFILHKGNNETQPGDILFRFYELGADGEFDGIDCETEVGSALVSLEQSVIDGAANADAYHVSFTTPISFTTASTGFAIKIQSTGALRFKAQDNFLNASGLWVGDDGDPVGAGLRRVRLSIAGTPPTVDNTSIPTLTLEDFNSGQPILRVSAPGIPGGLDIYRSTTLGLGGWGSPVANGVADGATFTDVAAPAGKSFYIGVTNGDPAP